MLLHMLLMIYLLYSICEVNCIICYGVLFVYIHFYDAGMYLSLNPKNAVGLLFDLLIFEKSIS